MPPQVALFYGDPGSGKSTAARKWREQGQSCYVVPVGTDGTLWLDGYEGQDLVVMDEYHGGIPLVQLLRLLDGFHVRVPVKGGFTWYLPKRVAFSSTSEPGDWYNYNGRMDMWHALLRRLTLVVLCRRVSGEYHKEELTGGYLDHWKRLRHVRDEPRNTNNRV